VATAIVPPIDTVLPGHGLKLSDLPIKRVAPHGDEQLRCRVHGVMILPAISGGKPAWMQRSKRSLDAAQRNPG